MVSTITEGYLRKCKNSIAGVSEVYLFPYVKYPNTEIITNENVLVTFPQTVIYNFYANGNPLANENQETDAGGKFWNQTINLDLQYQGDAFQLEKFLKKDYRVIYKDRNGNYRIYGLYKGLEAGTLTYNTGSNKSEINGFKIDFTGKEEKQSFFIDDLEEAGFLNADFDYRITEAGEFRLTETNEFRILE